jgi:hypothetical protein
MCRLHDKRLHKSTGILVENMKKVNYLLSLIIFTAIGCKKPYTPPEITAPGTYLVVEGVINTGPDSTIIKLSHTVSLSGKTAVNPQTKATVTVESDQNVSYPLAEISAGKYISTGLNLDNTRQYRLRIKTPDNQQYLSDFVASKVTPPIDSIGYTVVNGQVQIYVNAHDPNNNTHYYRWDYTETWQYHAMYASTNVTTGTAIVPRLPAQQIYTCFSTDVSTSIYIGSTAALNQDVIYQAPLAQIASTSEKIEARYSILLRQYALTSDAYTFWLNLKKNTENLGSIFDAQPSTSVSNIHNINNAAEIVVGYVSTCNVQTKRIFISSNQLPNTWHATYPYTCTFDTNLFKGPFGVNQVAGNLIPLRSPEIPIAGVFLPGNLGPVPDGYTGSDSACVDCTIRGTKIIPSFW